MSAGITPTSMERTHDPHAVGDTGPAGRAGVASSAASSTDTVAGTNAGGTVASADTALDLLLIQEARHADAMVGVSSDRLRRLVERRAEIRVEIRRKIQEMLEAARKRSFWDKVVSGFKWVGVALGAAATLATLGGVAPLAVALGIGAGLAGGASALSKLGVGAAERDSIQAQAGKFALEGEQSDAATEMQTVEAFMDAVIETEAQMFDRAAAVVEAERQGLRAAATFGRRGQS